MSTIEFHSTLDARWADVASIRLGTVPAGLGTPDRYLTLDDQCGAPLRFDLFRSNDECYAFEEACRWCSFVAIGWGHHLYLAAPATQDLIAVDLGAYFSQLYPLADYLLVASAERMFCIGRDRTLTWQSEPVGIDGLIVDQVEDGVVYGQGEWDPPGGWRPFSVDLRTGHALT